MHSTPPWTSTPPGKRFSRYRQLCSVTLKRPFAQVNVLVPLAAVPTGQTAFSSAMKVKAPTTFDLFAGAATGAESVVEFSSSAINTVPFGKYATTHKWVGMNYVLVNSANTVEVTSFQESGMATAIVPGKVPAKMNGRTNLVGNIYDLSAEFNFNVQIGPGFDSEGEEPVIGQQTEITLADNSTYTEANPLTINASAAATPQNVTLRVNGHSFTEVLAGAAQGAAITAVSANTAVATASVSGNDVVITPVGNGQTQPRPTPRPTIGVRASRSPSRSKACPAAVAAREAAVTRSCLLI